MAAIPKNKIYFLFGTWLVIIFFFNLAKWYTKTQRYQKIGVARFGKIAPFWDTIYEISQLTRLWVESFPLVKFSELIWNKTDSRPQVQDCHKKWALNWVFCSYGSRKGCCGYYLTTNQQNNRRKKIVKMRWNDIIH